MRVAALYDIHGNLPALEAVLAEVRREKVDRVVVGGDVLPGPMPRETLERLLALDLPTLFIHGNGDRVVREQMDGRESPEVPPAYREPIRWSAQQLDADHQRVLAEWPATVELMIPGIGSVLFCHATPRNDTEIFTRLTADEKLVPVFAGVSASVVVCGHTHMQFDRMAGPIRVVNAGSVGMPFQDSGAYWLLLGPDIQLRRTDYDLASAAERVRRTSYPQAEDFASRSILQPPSEQATLESFAKFELQPPKR